MTSRSYWAGTLAAVILAGSGCGTSGKPSDHLSVKDAEADAPNPLLERVRKLQMVRVIEDNENKTPAEVEAQTVSDWIQDACDVEVLESDFGAAVNTLLDDRAYAVLRSLEWLCEARRLLELAMPNRQAVTLVDPSDATNYIVPPQSESTNAQLASRAILIAYHSLFGAKNTLLGAYGIEGYYEASSTSPETHPIPGDITQVLNGKTLGARLAEVFAEAYDVYTDAVARIQKATLASAESWRSYALSEAEAARLEYTTPGLSRYSAAEFAVGGEEEEKTIGFCAARQLSPPAVAALKVLRAAAPSPSQYVPDEEYLSTDTLLNGDATVEDNIRARLEQFWDQSFDVQESGAAGAGSRKRSVQEAFGISTEAFRVARDYLRQEHNAYSRSFDATVPPDDPSDPSEYVRYAASANDPDARPPVFYETVVRGDWRPAYSWVGGEFQFPVLADVIFRHEFTLNYAHGVDAALSIADELTRHKAEFGIAGPEVANALGPVVAQGKMDRQYRVTLEWSGLNTIVTVFGNAPVPWIRVVSDEEGLTCATKGEVEGVQCDSEDLEEYTVGFDPTVGQPEFTPPAGTGGFEYARSVTLGSLSDAGSRNYVVVADNYQAAPREWSAVAGMSVSFLGGDLPWDDSKGYAISVVPAAREWASVALQPDENWCARGKFECGYVMDERLPLENELSDDHDDVESSWKYYVALAREAATEADRLGDAYVDASIAESERSEVLEIRELQRREAALNELDTLQETCGTNTDPVKLLDLLGVDGDLSIPGSQCDAATPCPEDIPCVDGVCKPDLVALAESKADTDPDLRRIAKCLSDDEEVDFVSLGDTAVCLWHHPDTINRVCEGSDPETNPCPALAPARLDKLHITGSDEDPCGWGAVGAPTINDVEVTVDKPALLEYFQSGLEPDPDTDGAGGGQLCNDVRAARVAGSEALLTKIADTGKFSPSRVQTTAAGIGFDWDPWSAAITVDGARVFDTRKPGDWPCGPASWKVDPAAGALFSTPCNCADETARMQCADRMMNAVATLKAVTHLIAPDGLLWDYSYEPGRIWVPYHVTTKFLENHSGGPLGDPGLVEGTVDVVWRNFTALLGEREWDERWTMPGTQFRAEADPQAIAWMNGSQAVPYGESLDADGPAWIARGELTIDAERPFTAGGDKYWGGLGIGESDKTRGWYAKRLAGGSPSTPGEMHMYGEHGLYAVQDPLRFDPETLMDALEVLCEASVYMADPGRGFACEGKPDDLNSIRNLSQLSRFLTCVSNDLHRGAATTVFSHFPRGALDAMRQQSAQGSFGESGGQHGAALGELRAALTAVQSIPGMLAHHVRQIGLAMETLNTNEALSDVRDSISEVMFSSKLVGNMADCMTVGVDFWNHGTRCANAVAQISFARELADLEEEGTALSKNLAVINFRESLDVHMQAIEGLVKDLDGAKEKLDAALAALETMRLSARSALAKAVYRLSTKPGSARELTGAIASRARTAQVRYQRSRENAIKMALLAKRAIEQRLGVRLSTLYEDMPLVEAPASWESDICMSGGVDYSELSGSDKPIDYSAGYVGDYVTRLENVVESYRQVYAFHEGTDTAVVSLRDDVMKVRAPCDVPVENLLYHTDDLTRVAVQDEPSSGWSHVGCATLDPGDGGTEALAPNCIAVKQTGDLVPAPSVADQATNAFEITFGNADGSSCVLPDCGYQSGAVMLQAVNLPDGPYRMSWFAMDDASAGDGADIVNVKAADETELLTAAAINVGDDLGSGWRRYDGLLDISEAQQVTVEVRGSGNGDQFLIGGLMLEPVHDQVDPEENPPQVFAVTGNTLTVNAPLCEDTDGSAFRDARYWNYRSINLCSDGYSDSCTGGASEPHYFWETTFSIAQLGIESGDVFSSSGFARGNYNYRIESIGLNIVGTGTRSCADEELANACYSGGFFPFSLEHNGPFTVRNHRGEDVPVYLFDGRIEHARALATERYLSNPMSSADQELMNQFTRYELTGRPLNGNFVLRIWDEPGVDFTAVEDIQLVLNYRYWTRFD